MEITQNRSNVEFERDKIRERYKGIDVNKIEVIPAKEQDDFYDENKKRRVAVYARVSTDNIQQVSSYELQRNYYEDYVARHPLWTLVDLYSDEGISGTSLENRDAFNRMIADCEKGKIDIIITKSVSRFARNLVDCITVVRKLLALPNPVGVFFETEGIFTPNDNAEMQLSFIATLAQEESHTKSQSMIRSLQMRFSHGIVLTPVLLGYDHDENKQLIVNYNEARVVRLIFYMYLFGHSCKEIADALTDLECQTKIGNVIWSDSSVYQILRNERYCGDVLTWKTFTPSYIDHKSIKNRNDRIQHHIKDHHEPIIERDDFIAVQRLLDSARYGNKDILPKLQVVKEGALKGFVTVHPKWFGFSADDYRQISNTVETNIIDNTEKIEFEANEGDFDLRGFEVARSQFFDNPRKMSVTFSNKDLKFSSMCIKKFKDMQYVELLVHPQKKLLAVRVSGKAVKNSLRWAKLNNYGNITPRNIAGSAFIPTLYELFGWNKDYKYRIQGIKQTQGDNSVLIFNVNETELFIPQDNIKNGSNTDIRPIASKSGKSIVAFPNAWANNFGNNYYKQSKGIGVSIAENGCISVEATVIDDENELNVTSPEMVVTNIERLMKDIKQEDKVNGYPIYNE